VTLQIRHVTGLDETAEYKHIDCMTQAYSIQGRRPGLFSTVARTAFLAVAAFGGLFMLLASAAFALFAVAGIAVIGFLIFGFFWAKAKITGKPFGPKAMMGAQFEQMRQDMESQMGGASPKAANSNTGVNKVSANGQIRPNYRFQVKQNCTKPAPCGLLIFG